MTSIINQFRVGDKVRIVNIPITDDLYGKTGTYAGNATNDYYIGIIILDEPLPEALAICMPYVCLDRV